LCAGATPDEREEWALGKAEFYTAINQSGCYTLLREAPDDVAYAATVRAMRVMGFSDSERKVTIST
jgi:myosin heavy subunit